MRFAVLLCATFASAVTSGCSASSDNTQDQGSTKSQNGHGTSVMPTQKLELVGDSYRQLDFDQPSPLRVRLLDLAGDPRPDTVVSFALLGRSLDSSLAGLTAVSDEDGAAEMMLTTGGIATSFRVRISAQGAEDVFVDVGVSNAGFGILAVTLVYDGRRAVAQRSLYALANKRCDDAVRSPGDPSLMLDSAAPVAYFLALPAQPGYAVTATAQGKDGTVVAQGCSDGGNVFSDAQTTLELQLTDAPLQLGGEFSLGASLDTSAPAQVFASALRAATESVVKNDTNEKPVTNPEGRFLLDSLDGALRSDAFATQSNITALANELSDARMNPVDETPEHALSARLSSSKQGPLAALGATVDYSQQKLGTTRLFAKLALSTGKRPLAWQNQRIEALPLADGASPPTVDLSGSDAGAAVSASFVREDDVLELASVNMHAQLGLLAAQTLTKVLSSEVGGHGDEIRTLMGCTVLRDWLAEQSFKHRSACDTTCMDAACDRAVTRLHGAGQGALVMLDMTRPDLTLAGTLVLVDSDGDLHPDLLHSEDLVGTWQAESSRASGDAVTGSGSASPSPSSTNANANGSATNSASMSSP